MFYGLDLHKRFIQVCRIDGEGRERHDFQVETTHDAITAFAETLGPDDAVVLEATFHTWAVWALLVPHAGRVLVANPLQVRAEPPRLSRWLRGAGAVHPLNTLISPRSSKAPQMAACVRPEALR